MPNDDAFKPVQAGIEIQREFLDRDGKAIDLTDVHQGDLVAIKTRVRSVSGPIQNVVIVNLLPSGLEVENPRLSEHGAAPLGDRRQPASPATWTCGTTASSCSWTCRRTRGRRSTRWCGRWRPGKFRLPPVQAEAMYNPAIRATGERGEMEVKVR